MSELQPGSGEPAGRSVVLSALRRAWVWIAISAVVVGVAAYEVSLLTPERYEASSTIVLRSTQPFSPLGEGQGGGDPERFLSTQIALAGSADVMTTASAAAGVDATPAELAEEVTFTPSTASDAFTVTATGATGAEAAARANAVLAAYQQSVTDQVDVAATAAATAARTAAAAASAAELNGAAAGDLDAGAAARAAIAEGENQAGLIQARQQLYGNNVVAAPPADEPTDPTEPRPARNALIGAVLAALVAAAVAVWRRGRSREDVEDLVRGSGVPLIGVVTTGTRRDQPVTEALAPLVSLRYLTAGRQPGPVLVTGLQQGDATGEVVLSLAAAAAYDGRSVLVLAPAEDAAGVISRSGLPVAPLALTPRAAEAPPAAGSLAPVPALSHLPGRSALAVLDSGLLQSDALVAVLGGLTRQFDLVVVAAGPVGRDPRAFAVLRGCATAVAVVRADRPAAQLSAAWDELQDRLSVAGRSLDGVVVTQKAGRGRRRPAPSASSAPSAPSAPSSAPANRPAPVTQATPAPPSPQGPGEPQGAAAAAKGAPKSQQGSGPSNSV